MTKEKKAAPEVGAATLKRRLKELKKQLNELGPLMRGSVVVIGTRNKQPYFSVNVNRKTHMKQLVSDAVPVGAQMSAPFVSCCKHKEAVMTRFAAILVAVTITCMSFPAQAGEIPQLINYQGRLVDGTNLVSADVEMVLRLYDTNTLGNLLYEDSNTVGVVDGLYSTFIGDDTLSGSLTDALTNTEVWIEVEVNQTVLTPRERLVSAAYAIGTHQHAMTGRFEGQPATNELTNITLDRLSWAATNAIQASASGYQYNSGTGAMRPITIVTHVKSGPTLDLIVKDIDSNDYDPDDASWASWDLYLTWTAMH